MSSGAQKGSARKWIFLLALAALLVAVSILLLSEKESSYRGKSLSEWLEAIPFEPPHDPPVPEAQAAVRAIGTNALPFLLEWVVERDSSLRQALIRFDNSQNVLNLNLKPAERKAQEAIAGFMALAEIAEPAVNYLVPIAKDTNRVVSSHVCEILPYLGRKGIEASLQMLSNSNDFLRRQIVFSLARPYIGGPNRLVQQNPEHFSHFAERYQREVAVAAPTLIGLLADENVEVATAAATALAILRLSPSQAVPALTNICANQAVSERVRQNALLTLGCYGRDARSALPFLVAISSKLGGDLLSTASISILLITRDTSD